MAISLNKKTGINLKKGSKISLVKAEKKLEKVCIGLNWGVIEKKVLLGLTKINSKVDLDGSVTMFDKNNNIVDTVYYYKLISNDKSITHSGDDRVGDIGGDDGLDNEIIEINLNKVNSSVQQIVFYLTSYKKQDFSTIPYSKIRILEGNRKHIEDVFATFNLSNDDTFKGKVSMIMGKLIRTKNNWDFKAIGEPGESNDIMETIKLIQKKYL